MDADEGDDEVIAQDKSKEYDELCNKIEKFVASMVNEICKLLADYDPLQKHRDATLSLHPEAYRLLTGGICSQLIADQEFADILGHFLATEDKMKTPTTSKIKTNSVKTPILLYDHKEYIIIDLVPPGHDSIPDPDTFARLTTTEQLRIASECIAFTSYYTTFRTQSKFCYIKGDQHSHSHVFFVVELVSKQWWQNCLSPGCVDTQRALKSKTQKKDSSIEPKGTQTQRKFFLTTKVEKNPDKGKVESAKGVKFPIKLDDPIISIITRRLATLSRLIYITELINHNQLLANANIKQEREQD
jgi:hypothetical protein